MLDDFLLRFFTVACVVVLLALVGLVALRADARRESRADAEWRELFAIRTFRDDPATRPGIRALYDAPGHEHGHRRPDRPDTDRLPPWWSTGHGLPPGGHPLLTTSEAVTHG